jgi:hypothetical protein
VINLFIFTFTFLIHQPCVAKPTYLVHLVTFPDTPNLLSLGKYKFDTWFSLSEVLHDSSARLWNPLSYIHTYELSTGNIKEDMVCEGILA